MSNSSAATYEPRWWSTNASDWPPDYGLSASPNIYYQRRGLRRRIIVMPRAPIMTPQTRRSMSKWLEKQIRSRGSRM